MGSSSRGTSRGREARTPQVISLDTHKRYSLGGVEMLEGEIVLEERIEHRKGAIRDFLGRCEPGSSVAVEISGNWYWIVDEIEQAGMVPRLVHARKARARRPRRTGAAGSPCAG